MQQYRSYMRKTGICNKTNSIVPKGQGMTLCLNDFIVNGEKIFFPNASFNGLFQADLRTGKAEMIGVFPNEELLKWHIYAGIHQYGKYIILIPCTGEKIAVYNIEKNVISQLPYSQSCTKGSTRCMFYTSILAGKYVYAFGGDWPEIVRIDMETLNIKRYTDWGEDQYSFGTLENHLFYNMDICQKGNSLFIGLGQRNAILELNMSTDKIVMHRIGRDGKTYNTLSYDGIYFWLISNTGEILRIDSEKWECQYKQTEIGDRSDFFFSSIYMDGDVWLFSSQLDNIYKINCDKFALGEKELVWDNEDRWFPNKGKYGYSAAKRIGERQFAVFCAQDSKLHILKDGKEVWAIKLYTTYDRMWIYENQYYQLHKEKMPIIENNNSDMFGNVRSFIHYLKYVEAGTEPRGRKLNYGDKIYTFLNAF